MTTKTNPAQEFASAEAENTGTMGRRAALRNILFGVGGIALAAAPMGCAKMAQTVALGLEKMNADLDNLNRKLEQQVAEAEFQAAVAPDGTTFALNMNASYAEYQEGDTVVYVPNQGYFSYATEGGATYAVAILPPPDDFLPYVEVVPTLEFDIWPDYWGPVWGRRDFIGRDHWHDHFRRDFRGHFGRAFEHQHFGRVGPGGFHGRGGALGPHGVPGRGGFVPGRGGLQGGHAPAMQQHSAPVRSAPVAHGGGGGARPAFKK